MAKEQNNKLSEVNDAFASMLSKKTPTPPMQEVAPVKVKAEKEPEARLGLLIPESLKQEIEMLGVKQKKSLRALTIEAYQLLLQKNGL